MNAKIYKDEKMTHQPNLIEVILGLFAATCVGTLMMYVGGQVFKWDVTGDSPTLIGLILYFSYGGLFGVVVGGLSLLLWCVLRWKKVCVSWWVPPAFGALILGGVWAISGNMSYMTFAACVGLCSGGSLLGHRLLFSFRFSLVQGRCFLRVYAANFPFDLLEGHRCAKYNLISRNNRDIVRVLMDPCTGFPSRSKNPYRMQLYMGEQ